MITSFAEATEILAEKLPGYEVRPQQKKMAEFIEQAISQEDVAIVEAGTGSGKSLGAMIPAILSGKRVVVATSTIALQSQYVSKDIPFLEANLGTDFTWALLKGRSNYFCVNRATDAGIANVPALKALLDEVKDPDHDGDREHFDVTLTDFEWRQVCGDNDVCPEDGRCKTSGCYAVQARQKAETAQVIVTNTSMLLIDAKIREQTGGNFSMLGVYDVLVVDEAHMMEKIATQSFGSELKQGGVIDLLSKIRSFAAAHDGQITADGEVHDAFEDMWTTLPVPTDKYRTPKRLSLTWMMQNAEPFLRITDSLQVLRKEHLGTKVVRGDLDREAANKQKLTKRIDAITEQITDALTLQDHVMVRWAEQFTTKRGDTVMSLKFAPVYVGEYLNEYVWGQTTPVLMSATMATAPNDFTFIRERLGLSEGKDLQLGESFDYEHQALMFVPDKNQPEPKTGQAWTSYAHQTTLEMIDASGGGALLLFTSKRAMQAAYDAIAPKIQAMGYRTFCQGQGSKAEIAEGFKEDINSVLFGLASFGTGFDVQGDACRLVIIDKLTFPVPSDPIFAARAEVIDRTARNQWVDGSFPRLSIPMMGLDLKQFFGRLIRTKNDRGVVAILDSRISSKNYGKKVLAGLPPAPVTSNMDDVRGFYQ